MISSLSLIQHWEVRHKDRVEGCRNRQTGENVIKIDSTYTLYIRLCAQMRGLLIIKARKLITSINQFRQADEMDGQ